MVNVDSRPSSRIVTSTSPGGGVRAWGGGGQAAPGARLRLRARHVEQFGVYGLLRHPALDQHLPGVQHHPVRAAQEPLVDRVRGERVEQPGQPLRHRSARTAARPRRGSRDSTCTTCSRSGHRSFRSASSSTNITDRVVPVAVEQGERAVRLDGQPGGDQRQHRGDAGAGHDPAVPAGAGRIEVGGEVPQRGHHLHLVPDRNLLAAYCENAPLGSTFTPIRNRPVSPSSAGVEQIEYERRTSSPVSGSIRRTVRC